LTIDTEQGQQTYRLIYKSARYHPVSSFIVSSSRISSALGNKIIRLMNSKRISLTQDSYPFSQTAKLSKRSTVGFGALCSATFNVSSCPASWNIATTSRALLVRLKFFDARLVIFKTFHLTNSSFFTPIREMAKDSSKASRSNPRVEKNPFQFPKAVGVSLTLQLPILPMVGKVFDSNLFQALFLSSLMFRK